MPDVAWDADPNSGVAVYDSTPYNGQTGWYQVGGTSFGAPSWAALIADMDEQLMAQSGTTYDSWQLLSALYQDQSSTYVQDVVGGSNVSYTATTGYDLVTGIGSPIASKLLVQLVNQYNSVASLSGGTNGSNGGGSNGHGSGHGKK